MKRFILALMVGALVLFSCDPVEDEYEEPELVALDASQVVGRWDWTDVSHYTILNSGEVMIDEPNINSTYFTFYENGRYETSIDFGILVEGYWTLDGEGIHTFVKDEPLHTLLPIKYEDGLLTFKTPGNSYYNIVCKKSAPAEFAPGYGTVPPDDYFKSQQNLDAFKQAIEKEQAAFGQALNELKTIQFTRDNWQNVSQIETMWFSSYTVMVRCNQAIDALTAAGAPAAEIAPFRYLRAWSAYVRVVCWDYAATYWEHAGKDNTLNPIPAGTDAILTAALADLAGQTGSQAAALKADIDALREDNVPGKVLKAWGIDLMANWGSTLNFGVDLLPIPMSVLETNTNQLQTAGW